MIKKIVVLILFFALGYLSCLLLPPKSSFADSGDRSVEYIVNRVFDSTNTCFNIVFQ